MLTRLAPLAVVGGLVASMVGACSLILDTDNLPLSPIDAGPDARRTADPSMLQFASIEPAAIDEGVGTGGGRPAQIFVDAPNLISGATIELAWEDTTLPSDEPAPELVSSVVSGSRQALGLSVRVPELASLDEGATRAILVTVTQGEYSATFTIAVNGHIAYVAPAAIDTDALDPERIYSSISFPVNTRATGTLPLVLRTAGPVAIDAVVDVSGVGAAPVSGSNGPGAGGCEGGEGAEPLAGGQGQAGGCGAGGGAGGASSNDGGGGGYGSEGNGGTAGGDAVGNAMLAPLGSPSSGVNHGNGGGGGGGTTTGGGGDGGHGGGVVAIFAGGRIAVGAGGRVTADGGDGTAGTGGLNGGGAGGGGSGGAILLHTGVGIDGSGTLATALNGESSEGNAGGVGRIRIDNPAGTRTTNPIATYGATWPADAPTIVRDSDGRLTVSLGGTNGCYGFKLTNATIDPDGRGCGGDLDRSLPGEVELHLKDAGLNTLCVRWTSTVAAQGIADGPETETCIHVIYLQAD